jgi:hypothetical protein
MTTILATDWAPHVEAIARRLAQVCAVVYCLGYCTGAWLHRLNDRLAGRTTPSRYAFRDDLVHGAIDLDAAIGSPVLLVSSSYTQPQAAAIAPANIAPPVLIHISDPMARAVRMVRTDGKSQRLAASLCGVSRSSLQRALKVLA